MYYPRDTEYIRLDTIRLSYLVERENRVAQTTPSAGIGALKKL